MTPGCHNTDPEHGCNPCPQNGTIPKDQAACDAWLMNLFCTELNPAGLTYQQWQSELRVYQQMAAQHLAYRGNPDTPHLKVATVGSSAAVFTDCSTPSKTNPSVQYSVRTGQPVKSTVPPGLHPKVVTVLDQSGHWKVNSIIPNLGQTCTP